LKTVESDLKYQKSSKRMKKWEGGNYADGPYNDKGKGIMPTQKVGNFFVVT
jgi:hypothetical protein